jgi:hypothetical protein
VILRSSAVRAPISKPAGLSRAVTRRGVVGTVNRGDGVTDTVGVETVLGVTDVLPDVGAVQRVLLGDKSTLIARIPRGVTKVATTADRMRGVRGLSDIGWGTIGGGGTGTRCLY